MPLFHYQAINQETKKVSGIIEASSMDEAKAKLRLRGLMVAKLTTKIRISRKDQMRKEQLRLLTHQLQQLIDAGIPLYQSLLTLEEQYRGERFHRILLSLCDQVRSGSSLSEAMKNYPESFDTLYISMIAAGEASGSLAIVLERLSELLAKQVKLKKELQTAMIYPGILAFFSLIVIGLLLGFVVPSIEGIFEGRTLNSFTNAVLGLSQFARNWFWTLLVLTLGAGAALYAFVKSQAGALFFENWCLKTPLVKTLIVQAALTRFAKTLATLIEGGVPLLDALSMAKGVMKNSALEKEIEKAIELVIQGQPLSKSLQKSQYLPPLVPRMIAVGEDTGKLSGMLSTIADMHEESLEKSLAQLMALAQPVILIVMGGIIGVVMAAILLPMSDISSLT